MRRMARQVGGSHPVPDAAGDGPSEPRAGTARSLHPADQAEDDARRAVEGVGITARPPDDWIGIEP